MIFLYRTLVIILLSLAIIIGSQIDNYCISYINVFQGAKTENNIQYENLQKSGLVFHMSVSDFVNHLLKSEDEIIRASGEIHLKTTNRYKKYKLFEKELEKSKYKIIPVLKYYDEEIANAIVYELSLPVTIDSFIYIAILATIVFFTFFTITILLEICRNYF